MKVQFKSKHTSTISFTADSFSALLAKQFEQLECIMVDDRVIIITRAQLTCLWAKSKDWRKVSYSNTKVKILKVA